MKSLILSLTIILSATTSDAASTHYPAGDMNELANMAPPQHTDNDWNLSWDNWTFYLKNGICAVVVLWLPVGMLVAKHTGHSYEYSHSNDLMFFLFEHFLYR